MSYGPPWYGIFRGHVFYEFGGWGWSELFSSLPAKHVSRNEAPLRASPL